MSPECVTFQSSAVYFYVYLLLSLAEMRSEVTAAVVCYQSDEGMRDDTHLGHCHTDPHVICKNHMWSVAHTKRAVHDWKAP